MSGTHAVYFDHSLLPPSVPPKSLLLSLPTRLCAFFLFVKPTKPNLYFLYSHRCVAFQWSVVDIPEPTSLKKTDPPPQPASLNCQ